MTTKVTIKNESQMASCDNHIVLVKQGGQVVQKLYPGDTSSQLYVWNHSPITIEEAPLT